MQWTIEPENAMKRRKALVSEEELLETKSAKRVGKLLKHVSRLCTGMNRTKHKHVVLVFPQKLGSVPFWSTPKPTEASMYTDSGTHETNVWYW